MEKNQEKNFMITEKGNTKIKQKCKCAFQNAGDLVWSLCHQCNCECHLRLVSTLNMCGDIISQFIELRALDQ